MFEEGTGCSGAGFEDGGGYPKPRHWQADTVFYFTFSLFLFICFSVFEIELRALQLLSKPSSLTPASDTYIDK